MSLFINKPFISHSGRALDWKIDCDALIDDDLATLACVFARRLKWSRVIGIPRGGMRFAAALRPYSTDDEADPLLIVDDVWTTGASMEDMRNRFLTLPVIGAVIFARTPVPNWVHAAFLLTPGSAFAD